MSRIVPEWIGKTADSAIPARVVEDRPDAGEAPRHLAEITNPLALPENGNRPPPPRGPRPWLK